MKKKRRTSKSKGGTQSHKALLQSLQVQSLQDDTDDNCLNEAANYVNRTLSTTYHNGYKPRPRLNFSAIHSKNQWIQYLNSWIQYARERVHGTQKLFKSKHFIEKKELLTPLFVEYCRVNRILNEQSVSECNIHLYRFARIVILISFLIHEMVPDSERNMGKYLDDVKKERIKQLEQIEIIQNQINQCTNQSIKSESMKSPAERNAEAALIRICENAGEVASSNSLFNSLSNLNVNSPATFKHATVKHATVKPATVENDFFKKNANSVANATDYHSNANNANPKIVGRKYQFTSQTKESSRSELANRITKSSIRHNLRHNVNPNVPLNDVLPNDVPPNGRRPRRTLKNRFNNFVGWFKRPDPPLSNEPVTPKTLANKGRAFSNRVRGWFGYSPRYKTLKKHRFF